MMKRNQKGTGFIVAGLLLMAAALCLTGYNLWDTARAAKSSEAVLEQLQPVEEDILTSAQDPAEELVIPDYLLNPSMEMPEKTVSGNGYIGILSIPRMDRTLPVMGEWSYPKLKLAPCRYAGSVYTGDFVICAHNYKTHFGGIQYLSAGDAVAFTDMDGNTFGFSVVEVETLQPTAIEEMTSGSWDLTLFTCTAGGKARVAVRCEQQEHS